MNEAALVNRLDGTFAGPVVCLVTTPVYTRDRQAVVIPAGARLLGASSPVVSDARGHQRLLEDFVDAVHAHRDPICTGQDARKSVALVCAIYEAAKSGRWVEVNRE